MDDSRLHAYREECVQALNAVDLQAVARVGTVLIKTRDAGRHVFVAGNGGSATTATHMATDLMLGSQLSDPPLRVVALTDNQAIITATGNDLDFEQIFCRQLASLAQAGDVVILVSASGNSPNVVACAQLAQSMGVTTVGFTGFDGGRLANLVDLPVHVPTRMGAYGPVEDVHLAVNHMLTQFLRDSVSNGESR